MSDTHYLTCQDDNCEKAACVDRRMFTHRLAERDAEIARLKQQLADKKIDAAWEKSGMDMLAEAIEVKQERDSLKAQLARAERVCKAAKEARKQYRFEDGHELSLALAEWEKESGEG